jgi:hypothetical protein
MKRCSSRNLWFLKGGKAAGRSPRDFNQNQLRIGTRHEMEHTSDRCVAMRIAMDHLAEDKDYYRKLRKAGL